MRDEKHRLRGHARDEENRIIKNLLNTMPTAWYFLINCQVFFNFAPPLGKHGLTTSITTNLKFMKLSFNHPTHLMAAAMCVACLASCSEQADGLDSINGDGLPLSFTRSDDDSAGDSPAGVDVYVLKDDTLVKTLHSDDPGKEPVKVKNVGDGWVFATSGLSLDVEPGLTTETDMRRQIAVCPEGASSAPLFYSAFSPLNEEVYASGRLQMQMVRSVARIDLVNEADPSITVSEIIVDKVPSATYVFPCGEMPECSTMRMSHTFQTPFQGTCEGVTTVFGSENPVEVRIRGYYGDIPMDVSTTLPRVERNHVYTLQVLNVGSKVETAFSVKEWEEGGETGAGPDLGDGIHLDRDHSIFPEGVEVDYARGVITVPATGAAGMTIAFKSDTRIELSAIDGLTPEAEISANPVVTVDDGYISSFDINVKPQGKGRLGYSVLLHLRNALLSQSYDFVELRVENSPYQIETVRIGGHDWMCFNATSADLEDQIYVIDGIGSVEEMYEKCYAQCIGNYFQYGRPNPYSPWTSNDPNAVAMPDDAKPWTNPAYTPLPEGYHVASFAEWEDLVPNNTTIPSEYTCRAGERIRATMVTLPGTLVTNIPEVDNKKYLMRYVLFESLDTGNKLFVPINSQKSPGTSTLPGLNGARFEKMATYWVANDRCVWYIDYRNVDGADGAYMKEDKFNYNGFCPVRGIRDAE